eukprot:SAG25_NODE_13129_length_271_cov_0.593023_1_plen_53_part_01
MSLSPQKHCWPYSTPASAHFWSRQICAQMALVMACMGAGRPGKAGPKMRSMLE